MDIQLLKDPTQSYEAERAVDWLSNVLKGADDAIQLAWITNYMDFEKFEADFGEQILEDVNGGNFGNLDFMSFFTKIHDAMDKIYEILGGKYINRTPEK